MDRENLEQTQDLAGFDIHLLLDVDGMITVIGQSVPNIMNSKVRHTGGAAMIRNM